MTDAAQLGSARSGRVTETLIVQGLARIGMALRAGAWAGAGTENLTPTQAEILAFLDARAEPQRLAAIAEALAVSAATASDALTVLVKKKLVAKGRDGADGRAIAARLTAAGRKVVARTAHWPDFLIAAAATLNDVERPIFHRALVKMIRTLQVEGRIAPARLCVSCQYFRPNTHPGTETPHHCAYVDAAFGDGALRVDCADHEALTGAELDNTWRAFAGKDAPDLDTTGGELL